MKKFNLSFNDLFQNTDKAILMRIQMQISSEMHTWNLYNLIYTDTLQNILLLIEVFETSFISTCPGFFDSSPGFSNASGIYRVITHRQPIFRIGSNIMC